MSYQQNCTLPSELVEQIMTQGLEAVPEMISTLINLAMQVERQAYLGVGPSWLYRSSVANTQVTRR